MPASDVAVLSSRLEALEKRFDGMDEKLEAVRTDFGSLKVALATLSVKVGIGALVGGALMSVLVTKFVELVWK